MSWIALIGMAITMIWLDVQKTPHPNGYVAGRVFGNLSIDGKLDEPAWKAAPWSGDFVDIEGDARPKPRFRTRMMMLWDDKYLYIGAELEEPHVWATLTAHDSVIFQDPDFEVFIDPDGDNHQYYEIEINALNTEWDLRLVKPYRDGGPALNEWEIPGFRSAIHVNGTLNDPRDVDQGWTVEMAIPWRALGEFANRPSPPKPGDQWRINFSRVEWQIEIKDGKYVKVPGKREDNWVWSPQGAIDMHRPERWGYVQFSAGRPGTDRFKPDPTWPARDLLMQVYNVQRAHKTMYKSDWSGFTDNGNIAVLIRGTGGGWEAKTSIHLPDGRIQWFHVRDDSRLWADPPIR